MKLSVGPIMVSVCVLALSLCLGCLDATTEPAAKTPDAEPRPAEKPTLAVAWPEMKVLARLVGTWQVEHINRVAKWTPEEIRLTAPSTKELVLGGRFVRDEGGRSRQN